MTVIVEGGETPPAPSPVADAVAVVEIQAAARAEGAEEAEFRATLHRRMDELNERLSDRAMQADVNELRERVNELGSIAAMQAQATAEIAAVVEEATEEAPAEEAPAVVEETPEPAAEPPQRKRKWA